MTHRIRRRENRFLLGIGGNWRDTTRRQCQRGVLAPIFTWYGVRSTAVRFSRAIEFRLLRSRLPALWFRRYYAGSIGHVSEASVRKHIESQKGK
jgi:REP element-mobilizing transposase RayT